MDREERLRKLVPAMLSWFRISGRELPWREDPTPYHVWLSEVMLQQTRIEAVKPYYARFLAELPDIPSLAAAQPERLQKLWEGLGYYSRVRNLQKAAQQIMEQHGGRFPEIYEQIRALAGIGDYTAGAIASICFDLPTPAVDGNVLRVLARITDDPRSVTEEKTKAAVREELAKVYPKENCGTFTQALMELGETVCIPNGVPDCAACPCAAFCACRDGGWDALPVKSPKKPRRKETLTVLLLQCEDRLAVQKRGEKGLLAGLWEFPNREGELSAVEALTYAKQLGCEPTAVLDSGVFSHIFTHVEWEMRCYRVACTRMPEGFVWADADDLQERIALPTAFRKLLSVNR